LRKLTLGEKGIEEVIAFFKPKREATEAKEERKTTRTAKPD